MNFGNPTPSKDPKENTKKRTRGHVEDDDTELQIKPYPVRNTELLTDESEHEPPPDTNSDTSAPFKPPRTPQSRKIWIQLIIFQVHNNPG
jgi:hypothetical protein